MNRLLISFSVVLLMISGCKREGCNNQFAFNYDPKGTSESNCIWEPLEVEINFNVLYGEEELVIGKELSPDSLQPLSFENFGIYFTEISVLSNGDTYMLVDDAMLLLDTNRTYRSTYTPKAGIDGLIFNIGVNKERNDTLDPTTMAEGPFSPQIPSMYWSWASGYRFIMLNGIVDTSSLLDGSGKTGFQYHTGTNDLLRKVVINASPRIESKKIIYDLVLDFSQVLENVDFKNELSTHTADNLPLAIKISDNAQKAIRVR